MPESPSETEFIALALVFGKPPFTWIYDTIDSKGFQEMTAFVNAAVQIIGKERVYPVAVGQLAHDYAVWYFTQPNTKADQPASYTIARRMVDGNREAYEITRNENHQGPST